MIGGWEPSCTEPFFSPRHRTSLAPKILQPKATPRSSPLLLICPLLELKPARQTGLYPLCGMHLCVSESPLSRRSSPSHSQGLGCIPRSLQKVTEEVPFARDFPAPASLCCSQAERAEAIQDPCGRLHWVIESQGLEPSKTHIRAWDPASRSWLPTV